MLKKVFMSFVALAAIAAAATGPARAQSTTESFTITFKTTGSGSDGTSAQTTIEGIIANGADYVSEVNATKVYQAKDGYGIKLGSSSATGSLTLTLANAVENVTSIVVNAQQYGNGTSERTLQIQGDNYTTTNAFADYTYTYTTPATVSTITLATTTKRAYIKSVTVNYTTSTGGGGSTPEPEPEPAVPHTVRFADGNDGWSVKAVSATTHEASAAVTAPDILQNVMAGDSLVVTAPPSLDRKVKSVKAVKFVAPVEPVAALQTLIVSKGSTGLSGNKELYYMPGDTYRQALARTENQSTDGLGWGMWESAGLTTVYFKEVSTKAWDMAIDGDSNFASGQGSSTITLDTPIDPTNHTFQFVDSQ